MTTTDQIEAYLIEAELPFEQVGDGLWLIHDEADFIDNIVLIHNDPVVTFRVKLMEAPQKGRLELFQRLLELNATSMVAGAYGLEENAVVIVDTLQGETLDFHDFQGSIDSIALAMREHYEELRAFADSAQKRETTADAEPEPGQ
jgi:hypothetical protein